MPGQNDRRHLWTLGDQTFSSEAEYRREQERRVTELFELLETEDVVNSNRQYALALKYGHANADQNRSANGHTNGHDSTAIAGTGLKAGHALNAQRPVGVAGVEPTAPFPIQESSCRRLSEPQAGMLSPMAAGILPPLSPSATGGRTPFTCFFLIGLSASPIVIIPPTGTKDRRFPRVFSANRRPIKKSSLESSSAVLIRAAGASVTCPN